MDESDDFCPTRPKRAKLIHAACVTVLRVDEVASMVHLIPSGAWAFVDPRRGDQFRVAVGGESDHLLRLVDFVVMEPAQEYFSMRASCRSSLPKRTEACCGPLPKFRTLYQTRLAGRNAARVRVGA